MRFRQQRNDFIFDEEENPKSSDHLYMNGSEIFSFTLDTVPVLVQDILKKKCFIAGTNKPVYFSSG